MGERERVAPLISDSFFCQHQRDTMADILIRTGLFCRPHRCGQCRASALVICRQAPGPKSKHC